MKKFKLPKFALFAGKPKKLQATTAARRASSESYYDEEPKTNLSSAFVVVLVLHVVAVGGIYAFNSLRASRGPQNPPHQNTSAAPAVGTPLATKTNAATPAPEAASVKSAPAPVSKITVYHVQPGDSLTKIAALYGVSVADLEDANGIKVGSVLRPNQTITIPGAKAVVKPAAPSVVQDSKKAAFLASKGEEAPTVAAQAAAAPRIYTVAKDDTLTSIAKKFGTTPADLSKLNKIDDPKKMKIGQPMKIPAKKN